MRKTKKELEQENFDLKQLIIDSEKIGLIGNNSGTSVTNCSFAGVQWDATAVKTIQTVAQGLVNLTELFKSQNIQLECMLKVESPKTNKI